MIWPIEKQILHDLNWRLLGYPSKFSYKSFVLELAWISPTFNNPFWEEFFRQRSIYMDQDLIAKINKNQTWFAKVLFVYLFQNVTRAKQSSESSINQSATYTYCLALALFKIGFIRLGSFKLPPMFKFGFVQILDKPKCYSK